MAFPRASDPSDPPILPDVLVPNLDIVFCGTAAGAASARQRAYYAGPGNAFWPTLFAVGLTPRQLLPHEYGEVVRWKLGFTDLAKGISGSDSDLAPAHFDAGRLRRLIGDYRPRIVAFTGKRAAAAFMGHAVGYGLQADRADGAHLFVLPSPSGAARRFWDPAHWRELARLRRALGPAGRQSVAPSTIATP
jgi:TDG/mug DNA glycosylase family protein